MLEDKQKDISSREGIVHGRVYNYKFYQSFKSNLECREDVCLLETKIGISNKMECWGPKEGKGGVSTGWTRLVQIN